MMRKGSHGNYKAAAIATTQAQNNKLPQLNRPPRVPTSQKNSNVTNGVKI